MTAPATTVGKREATVVSYPPKYHEYPGLRLYYQDKAACSVDQIAAKKYAVKATAPADYVSWKQGHGFRVS